MRNIKFRAKSLDGNWLCGDLIQNRGKAYILPVGIAGSFVKAEDFEVDENTVGQFTGLKDSNEKEIYEGDIVNCHDVECEDHSQDVKASVIWNHVAFFLKFPEGTYVDSLDNMQYLSEVTMEPYTTLEVVGNIFD